MLKPRKNNLTEKKKAYFKSKVTYNKIVTKGRFYKGEILTPAPPNVHVRLLHPEQTFRFTFEMSVIAFPNMLALLL